MSHTDSLATDSLTTDSLTPDSFAPDSLARRLATGTALSGAEPPPPPCAWGFWRHGASGQRHGRARAQQTEQKSLYRSSPPILSRPGAGARHPGDPGGFRAVGVRSTFFLALSPVLTFFDMGVSSSLLLSLMPASALLAFMTASSCRCSERDRPDMVASCQ